MRKKYLGKSSKLEQKMKTDSKMDKERKKANILNNE